MVSARLKATLALVAGALVLGVLVAYVGPASVAEAIGRASPAHLGLAALTYAAFFVLRGIRWRALLRRGAPDVRLSTTTSCTAVGWLANSILPLKGGDVLRAALVARRENLSVGHSAATVALERVLDLVGLAVVAAVALALLPTGETPAWMARALEVAWLLPLVALAMLALLVAVRERAMAFSARTLGRLGKFGHKLHGFIDTTASGLAALAERPRLLLRLVPLTLLVAVAQALVFAFLVLAFMPETPALVAFGGSALFLLSFIVSVTPGNVGTYEAAFVAVFVALGASSDIAVPAAILTHLTTTLIVAGLGALGMLALGIQAPSLAPRPTRLGGSP